MAQRIRPAAGGQNAAKGTEGACPVYAELYASTSALDTDFCARMGAVHRDGSVYSPGAQLMRCRYRNGETAEPMIPGKISRFRIEAANTCIVLQPGVAIRLDTAGSLFPDDDRSLNTFGSAGHESVGTIAHQTICHNPEHPSALILPITPRPDRRVYAPFILRCHCPLVPL